MEICYGSSDDSVEEIEIKAVRPVPRSRNKEKFTSPARSLSPNSMLNASGDQLSIKKCIDVSFVGDYERFILADASAAEDF